MQQFVDPAHTGIDDTKQEFVPRAGTSQGGHDGIVDPRIDPLTEGPEDVLFGREVIVEPLREMPAALAISAMDVFAKPCRANSAIAPSSSASDVEDGSVITI